MKLKQFIQQEMVLTAAAVLAVISAFFVPPDVQYLGYIDPVSYTHLDVYKRQCAHCPHRLGITQSQRHSVDLCCRI